RVRRDEHAAATGSPRRRWVGAARAGRGFGMTATGDRPEAAPFVQPRPPRDIPHLLVPEKRKISHWNDRHELRVNNWIEPWDFASDLDVGLISVPFSKTSILPNGAYAAPNALKDAWAIFTTF